MRIRSLLSICIAFPFASCGTPEGDTVAEVTEDKPSSPYLYVWAGDADEADTDFLIVVDADPESPSYGSVLATAPVGSAGNDPHHAEPVAPSDGLLFANGFDGNRTFLFDLSDPLAPTFTRELAKVAGYEYVHSFHRLDNGHVLATLQFGDGTKPGDTGGLAEFDPSGSLVRVTSAVDPALQDKMIRPYAVWPFEAQDRVLTSSFSMMMERAENVVQVWRLSDLTLLKTLPLPPLPAPNGSECLLDELLQESEECAPDRVPGHDRPFEIRALPDGSALLNTVACGFYRIDGIGTDEPTVQPVLNLPEDVGCAVTTVVGDFMVVPIMFEGEILTLDVSDAARPVEVARMAVEDGYHVHWAQVDPGTNRIAVTGWGPDPGLVRMYRVDPATGALVADEAFGQVEAVPSAISLTRDEWPHGPTGPAVPHAALFGR